MDITSSTVLLGGSNGSGKTSILEAISVLMPGRGFRNSQLSEIVCRDVVGSNNGILYNAWQIDASFIPIVDDEERLKLRCTYYKHRNQKEMVCKGKILRNSSEVLESLAVVWFIPQMEGLFRGSAMDRRKFLDRMVYNFARDHAMDVVQYNQQLRSRLKLLKEGYIDNKWLNGLENNLAELAIRIALKRIILLHDMNAVVSKIPEEFNKPCLKLSGKVEQSCFHLVDILQKSVTGCKIDDIKANNLQVWLKQHADFAERYNDLHKMIAETFMLLRNRDKMGKQSHYGVQKSDLLVYDSTKNMLAKNCSTGEQKALLISLIIAQTYLVIEKRKDTIKLLLLDDVLEHLDSVKRSVLLNLVKDLPVQTWITGTNLDYCRQILQKNTDIYL